MKKTQLQQIIREEVKQALAEVSKQSELELLKAYILKKYPNDMTLQKMYNGVLNAVQINSTVDSWKKITPI